MAKISQTVAAAAIGVALTACAAGGTSVQPVYIGSYDPEMLRYAASKGAVLVEVVGNPFDAPKEEVDAAVARSMTGATFGRQVSFTSKARADYESPYRIVVVLDPASGAQASRLCSEPGQPTATSPDRLRAMAAFCSRDVVITSIAGSTAKVRGPGDARFRELIRRMTMDLFPTRDPDEDADGISIRIP